MKTAYLTGYTGKPTRNPEQLRQLAINLGAVVVDSRYNPQSRVAHWNREALRNIVGRSAYLHLRSFGNRNYRAGSILLDNPDHGLNLLNQHTTETFIILCGETCHRKQVGEYLAANGWTVREVTQAEWEAAR